MTGMKHGGELSGSSGLVDDLAPPHAGRVASVVGLIAVAVGLAALPAVVGLGLAPVPLGQVAVGLGGLAAVVGGAKLLVAAWALAARLTPGPGAQTATVSVD